jgi:hypothetical protein
VIPSAQNVFCHLLLSQALKSSPVVWAQRVDVFSQLIASWRKLGRNIRAILETIGDRCHAGEVAWKPSLIRSRLHKDRPTSAKSPDK